MSIPTFRDVWSDGTDAEIEIAYRWPRPPETRGDERLRQMVDDCLGQLGPYEPGLTFPQVQDDLERQLLTAGLEKVALITELSLASEFMSAAVAEAEESARQEIQAAGSAIDPSDDNAMDFILRWASLDRARRASRKAVMLAIASLEAHINFVAATELAIWEEEDRLSLLDKWIVVARAIGGQTFDRGLEPFQSFTRLVGLRNRLVHPKARRARYEYPNVGRGIATAIFTPEGDAALDSGREACRVARSIYLEFARLTEMECPTWVSVVPPTSSLAPDDWIGASIRNGIRPDPDFPDRHDHPDALPLPWITGDDVPPPS